MSPRNLLDLLYQPRSSRLSISSMLLPCLNDTRLHRHSSSIVTTSGAVSFMVQPGTLLGNAVIYPRRHSTLSRPLLLMLRTQTFTAPYAHTVVPPSTLGTSMDWVVDSGASHHLTTDLAALALHAPYTASDSVIIGDGSGLSFSNIGSFSLTSLSTPLLFSNVLHVPAMFKNLILVSALCTDNPINVLFFYSFFQMQDRHTGVTLVHEHHRDGVYY